MNKYRECTWRIRELQKSKKFEPLYIRSFPSFYPNFVSAMHMILQEGYLNYLLLSVMLILWEKLCSSFLDFFFFKVNAHSTAWENIKMHNGFTKWKCRRLLWHSICGNLVSMSVHGNCSFNGSSGLLIVGYYHLWVINLDFLFSKGVDVL